MDETRIRLSALWVSLMLIYLLGDVMRIFSGDFEPGKMGAEAASPWMWIAAAGMMLIPILMVYLTLVLPQGISRWASIILSVAFLLFNAAGLPGYPGAYDKFLLAVSFVFNVVIVWQAWRWV